MSEISGVYRNRLLVRISSAGGMCKSSGNSISENKELSNTIRDAVQRFLKEGSAGLLLKTEISKIDGVWIGDDENNYMIVTDIYGKLPIYVYEHNNAVVLFSHFDELLDEVPGILLTLDIVGIWESMIYGMAIDKRTIFNEIKLLGPASVLLINKNSGRMSNRYYDNLSFSKNQETSKERVGKTVAELLQSVLSQYKIDHCLLPLSGGVDSRLLAASLTKVLGPDNITALSFASRRNSYELVYAKRVCEMLGIKDWRHHILTPQSYTRSLQVFPKRTGGMISIAHGHLYDALVTRSPEWEGMTLVSGAFADAAGGYGAQDPRIVSTELSSSFYCRHLDKMNGALDLGNTANEILNDISNIYNRWKNDSSIETFNEFSYINQRQTRLLFAQSLLYQDILPVVQPYSDGSLSQYLLGLPYEIRHYKQSIRYAIRHIDKRLFDLPDISSLLRRKYPRDYYHHFVSKVVNNSARVLTTLSNDKTLFFSPYQTECQDYYLRTYHRNLAIESLNMFLQKGIISGGQFKLLADKPYKQYGGGIQTAIQYSAITIAPTFRLLGIGS